MKRPGNPKLQVFRADRAQSDAEDVRMRCSCGAVQVQKLDADMPMKKALREVDCLFCGVVGQMKLARAS